MSKKKVARREREAQAPPPDRRLAYAMLPLRFFLGATFLYAGLQKIADPGFLNPGAPTYIGTQLSAFAVGSPIGFLIESLALPAPQLAGLGVIAAELVIGAAVVLGVATRWAAAAGAFLNFILFLTASWTVQPYFLGSDSIYAVAWITLALVGDQGLYTAGPHLLKQLGFTDQSGGRKAAFDPSRRRLLVQAGAAAVAMVWILSVLPRTRITPQAWATPSPSPTPATPGAAPASSPSPAGTRIGSLATLRAQGSLAFNDPASGDPALAVQLSGGSVVAFDAVCTHAGCQVGYDTGQKLFVCPCHGAEFDPSRGAAVVAGPAPTPLSSIKVTVASDGNVYTA